MISNDTIQLMEDAVKGLLPPYADEDDMYEALDKCAMTERQIYDEVGRRCPDNVRASLSIEELSALVRSIIFDAFTDVLDTIIAHKAPLYV